MRHAQVANLWRLRPMLQGLVEEQTNKQGRSAAETEALKLTV